jgi:hypothetical protein
VNLHGAPEPLPYPAAEYWIGRVRELIGTTVARGWRHVFCWLGVFIVFCAYMGAIRGTTQIDLGSVNALALIILGAFTVRAGEKWVNVAGRPA